MFYHMFHPYRRRSHPLLHILAWLGAFLLGWKLGRQGFKLPGFKSDDGFIDYPNSGHGNRSSRSTFSSTHTFSKESATQASADQSLESEPELNTSSVPLTEETSGPSEQPI